MKDKYIRKQDVVDYCKALMNAELVQNTDDWGYGKERYNQTEVILEFIENRQPADVAPVVRCKDCLFFTTEKSCCRPEGLIKAREDDFCSYGERREE